MHHDLEPQKSKGRGAMILLLIIILMAAVGGGVYYWQKIEAKKLASTTEEKVRNEMQAKLDASNNQTTDFDQKLSESEKKIAELENNINKANQMISGMVADPSSLNFSIQVPSDWHIDIQRSSTEEIVFNIDGKEGESREAIKYISTTQDLNGYKDEFLKQFDTNIIEEIKTIKIGTDKTSAYHISTTEFGMQYILVKYPKRIYVFTTQGAMLNDGILDTFKPIYISQ